MVGYTFNPIPEDFSPLTELRDLKIRIITEDIKFDVNLEPILPIFKFNVSNYLNFIIEEFPDAIISGSLALNLHGLLDRPIKDIDLITTERPNFSLQNDRYGDENIKISSTIRLGYSYIKERFKLKNIFNKRNTYQVDFFIDPHNSVKYNTFSFNGKTLKIQDPVQIIEQKISMVNNADNYQFTAKQKHKLDLFLIFKNNI
jgi:hypothetical protein